MERVGSGGARWQCAKLNREEKLFLFFYIFNSFLTFFILIILFSLILVVVEDGGRGRVGNDNWEDKYFSFVCIF